MANNSQEQRPACIFGQMLLAFTLVSFAPHVTPAGSANAAELPVRGPLCLPKAPKLKIILLVNDEPITWFDYIGKIQYLSIVDQTVAKNISQFKETLKPQSGLPRELDLWRREKLAVCSVLRRASTRQFVLERLVEDSIIESTVDGLPQSDIDEFTDELAARLGTTVLGLNTYFRRRGVPPSALRRLIKIDVKRRGYLQSHSVTNVDQHMADLRKSAAVEYREKLGAPTCRCSDAVNPTIARLQRGNTGDVATGDRASVSGQHFAMIGEWLILRTAQGKRSDLCRAIRRVVRKPENDRKVFTMLMFKGGQTMMGVGRFEENGKLGRISLVFDNGTKSQTTKSRPISRWAMVPIAPSLWRQLAQRNSVTWRGYGSWVNVSLDSSAKAFGKLEECRRSLSE